MALTKIDDRGVTYPLDLLDNEKIRFGTGYDFEIYHNGTNSYLDNNTGTLFIRNNVDDDDGGNIQIQAKSGENSIVCYDDDQVKLYYDGVSKLATSSSGITVTGTLTSDGLSLGDNENLTLGASSDLKIWHDATDNFIKSQSIGNTLRIFTVDGEIKLQSGASAGENMLVANANGSVEIYHDNVKTIETAANGYVNLTGSSDLRLTLGSQGTAGTNDANWIRGEGVNLMYNSASGNHTWEVGGSEKLRLQSGGGISFNGDNQAANALDDYEYGTFTPTWNTDSASVTIGYHTQKGFYVKIGRMVYFQVYIRLNSSNAVSGGSGALAVHGLPFTPQNATSSDNVAYGTANIGYTNSWPGDQADRALVSSGSAKCYVYVGQSSGTNVVAGAGNLGNDTQFRASGSYVAA